ncbi:MAG: hypothetical protein M5R42_20455 [Rhodocyclaceae bacterium]|nr:hypothetical protein [Rhodocyclaceae bacterium]
MILSEKEFEALLDVAYQERGIEVMRRMGRLPRKCLWEADWAKAGKELLKSTRCTGGIGFAKKQSASKSGLLWGFNTVRKGRYCLWVCDADRNFIRASFFKTRGTKERVSRLIGCGALYDADLRRTRTSRQQSIRASAPQKKQVTKEALEKYFREIHLQKMVLSAVGKGCLY